MDLDHIRIQTTQNVGIDYEVASVGDRLLAAMLDWLVVIAWIFFMFLVVADINPFSDTAFLIFVWGTVFLYDLLFELLMNGQTPGKRMRRIKVARIDGGQPGPGAYLLRWVLRPIDIQFTFGAVAILAILWGGKGQRVGDMAAGTTVIKLRQRVRLEDTILEVVDDAYTPQFAEVSRLDSDDIAIVKEVVAACQGLSDGKRRRTLARRARERIAAKMGIETEMASLDFLETVVKDFNYYQGR